MKLDASASPESLRAIQRRLLGVKDGLRIGMRKSFQKTGERWHTGVSKRFTGSTSPTSLSNRSGALQRGIKHAVTGNSLDDLKLSLSVSGVPYVRIHEYGGEIKPKNSKYLTIPTVFNRKESGVARFPSARALISAHPKETFFRPGKRGGLYLFWNEPTNKAVRASTRKRSDLRAGGVEKGAPIPMFALVKKVDLPGPFSPSKRGPSRLGAHDTFQAELPNLRKDFADLAASITSGVSSALGGA